MLPAKQPSPQKSVFREYVEAIGIALILAMFIRTFVVQAFKIPSGSMEPTLLIGDHILVNKFIYGVKNPINGNTWISYKTPGRLDVVVFKFPEDRSKDFIKRVVGVGGDTIEIKNKKVFVNGNELVVPNAVFRDMAIIPGTKSQRDNLGPIKVPENSLFVMGDNRDNSHDSRFWKFVDLKDVKGKAFMLYWSWNKPDVAVRWGRLGNFIR